MSQSEQINELAAALSKAQGEFGHILKNKKVSFAQTKYDYADLADSFDVCRESLSKHGLSIIQPMQMLGNGWVIVTKLMHSSGQWVDSMLPISVEGKPQDIGSKITYMRKYQLWSMLGLATEDDDGQSEAKSKYEENQKNMNSPSPSQQINTPVERIGKAEIVALTTLIQSLDEESNKSFLDWIKKNFNVVSIQDIPKNCFEKCMIALNTKVKYLNDKNKQQNQMAVA